MYYSHSMCYHFHMVLAVSSLPVSVLLFLGSCVVLFRQFFFSIGNIDLLVSVLIMTIKGVVLED
ncbi:hypothetical protein RchiOBHm_Chr2g0142491 [Rosa chinensis]|uniref:Uncharacterized protein n=1 Tax=Rosa chinensis TaxID=74649 RepID=A0A2P6RXV0_ROSCH|nr:hypothetical protein RchiOBHm_Chr2g0142491 [Rosa chinensis]